MSVIFITLLVLVLLAIAAFSGNDRRYRRQDYYRHDDYGTYYPHQQLPMGYPPQYPQQFIEPLWGNGYNHNRGTSGLESLLGFILVMVVGLLGYLVFSNNSAGGARGRPDSGTETSYMQIMDMPTSATKSVFPREQTLLNVSSSESTPSKIYTIDIQGPPADDQVNEYEYTDRSEPLEGDVYIQTGSFSQLSGARTEQDRLRNLPDKRVLIHLDQTYGTEFKLLVGPFDSRDAASQYKKRNLSQEHFVKELSDSELNLVN